MAAIALKDNLPYDRLVHQLVTEPPTVQPDNRLTVRRFRRARAGEVPSLFDLINDSKPENLAGTTSRLFLGIKLECAQCHNDRSGGNWSQTEFWSFAAFFAGQGNQPDGQRTIAIPEKIRWSAPLSSGPGADLQTGRQFAKHRGRLAG